MTEQQIQSFVSQDGNAQLEVTVDQDTAWLSLDQMAALFVRDKSVISRHIRNVFKEGELERSSVVAKNATTASDGKTYQAAPVQTRLQQLRHRVPQYHLNCWPAASSLLKL